MKLFSRRLVQLLIVLAMALLYVGSRIKIVELGYEVSRLRSEISETKRENALLKSKVAHARSTERLAEWAERLGMTTPAANRVLFLNE